MISLLNIARLSNLGFAFSLISPWLNRQPIISDRGLLSDTYTALTDGTVNNPDGTRGALACEVLKPVVDGFTPIAVQMLQGSNSKMGLAGLGLILGKNLKDLIGEVYTPDRCGVRDIFEGISNVSNITLATKALSNTSTLKNLCSSDNILSLFRFLKPRVNKAIDLWKLA